MLRGNVRKLVTHSQSPHFRKFRRILVLFLGLVLSSSLLLWVTGTRVYVYPKGFLFWKEGKIIGTPPDYASFYAYEDALPQHNLDLPFPEGRTGRYVKFSNEIQQLGWNNVFNEVLMNTHLARASNRAYVFQDYHWKDSYHPWLIPPITFSRRRRHPQTPLTALISGPSAGGPWGTDDSSPRSVSVRYWETVCPPEERKLLYTDHIKPLVPKPSEESLSRSLYHYAGGPIGNNQRENWESPWGDAIFEYWKELLSNSPERCIEVVPGPSEADIYPQTFDVRMWATHKAIPMWESFSQSPVSTLLEASDLVKSGVQRNLHLFQNESRGWKGGEDPLLSVLAVHVRLGDFSDACADLLGAYNLTFYAWNLLPSLPREDVFIPPAGGVPSTNPDEEYVYGRNTHENILTYLDRCQPSIEKIVQKVHQVRASLKTERPLQTLYILTNSPSSQLAVLKEALREQGWERILNSHDLVLDDYQRDVEGAVDMEIARRAGGFIGNGWSSMTSNIVHQRLVSGHGPKSIRFW